MENISNRACEDKRRHAQTLPLEPVNSGSLDSSTTVATNDSCGDVYTRIKQGYERSQSTIGVLDQILEEATLPALRKANELGLLPPFPLADKDKPTTPEYLGAHADVLAVELHHELSESEDIEAAFPLLRFLALHLLRADNAAFVDDFQELVSIMEGPKDAAYFADVFEDTLVRLYNEKRDRLAAVTWSLPRYKRPNITEEEIKEDYTLGLVLRHWEREYGPTLAELEAEKEQLEAWMGTEKLDVMYWWSRNEGIQDGLSDTLWAKPSIALALDYWKQEGIAGDGITVDTIYEELFKVEDE